MKLKRNEYKRELNSVNLRKRASSAPLPPTIYNKIIYPYFSSP